MPPYDQSRELSRRAHNLIPGGAQVYSKGDDQFPELAPGFIQSGKGARVLDVDGNEFLDWGMGLRSVILGHAYESVLEAVRSHLAMGSNHSRPHPVEVDLAERLTRLIPCAEMVKFGKNGSDATSAAVRLARAYTGRDLIARCEDHPFFSVEDWFIGDTPCGAGVPEAVRRLTLRFPYNDLDGAARLFREHRGRIAGLILEPAACEEPRQGYLAELRRLCASEGALLIFDEMITGFRFAPGGAQARYGVTPDLAAFGKALANGFSVSALAGRRDVMELGGLRHGKERVFLLSTTHGGEIHSLAAALATVKVIASQDVCGHVARIGARLRDGLRALAAEAGVTVRAEGIDSIPYLSFPDARGREWPELRTLFLQETIRRGVLMATLSPSYSHTDGDVDFTLDAARGAFQVLRGAIERGTTAELLVGPAVKPVLRRFN
jgi:glutamate-1-semialdehyde 2,1-aminomutase